jgi:capsular exopolysaccharide synthesis family protein
VSRLIEALRNADDQAIDVTPQPEAPTLRAAAPIAAVARAEPTRNAEAPRNVKAPRDAEAIQSTDVFMGFHPQMDGKLVVLPAVSPSAVEQYRRLAASLHHAQFERDTKVLMITSASPGEGKTLTATNLALTLSQSYRRRVLLIDADLRRPSIHQLFQIPNLLGLTEGLKANVDQKLSLIQVSENLTVLPAGRPDPDPMGGLTSDRMRRIIQEAAARFDWVIIDTPPVGFLSDANLLVAMVDVALFVVRAGKSPYRLIQRALDAIGRNRILGVVLNAVDETADVAGYSYYGYYGTPRGFKG